MANWRILLVVILGVCPVSTTLLWVHFDRPYWIWTGLGLEMVAAVLLGNRRIG